MLITEITISTIVGAVAYFIIGWVVFELLLGKLMSANMINLPGFIKKHKESNLIWLFISCAAYSFLLATLFALWTGTTTLTEGMIIGTLIGGCISIMTSTYWWATSHLFSNFKPIFADFLAAMITVGVMGGIVAGIIGLLR
jgi:hypothetical protein